MSLDIKAELVTYLLTVTELTDLVGSDVYADKLPVEPAPGLPFVFFRRQGSGIIDQFDVRDRARLQFICEAPTPEEATAVYLALDATLHRKGNYAAGTATVRHSMRQSGPIDGDSSVSGNPQQVAYYIVRY